MAFRSSSIVVSSKGKKNPKNKNKTKCPKFKCNTVSVRPSACSSHVHLLSHQRKTKKKKGLETGL
jgi:hypothetical protein